MVAIIETERLHLRPLIQSDSTSVFRIMSDPEAMRFWDWPPLNDQHAVYDIVAGQIDAMNTGNAIYWAVCLGDTMIGSCDLSEIDRHHKRAEVGFLFSHASWGQGYAQEAMRAIADYAFTQLGIERLWARIHSKNESARRLLTRLGFSYEGNLRGHVWRDGIRRDCQIYGLLRSDVPPK